MKAWIPICFSLVLCFSEGATAQAPNTLTPDSNGINDTFGPEAFDIDKWKSFIVFDRWGNIVFEADELHPDWDGTMKGVFCQQGIYVWQLIAILEDGEEVEYQGHVTLLH